MFQKELSMMIEQHLFEHYFQPIFDLKNQITYGAELLLRAKIGTPDAIFYEAKKLDRLFELDTVSIVKALKSRSLYQDQLFFLNVFPSTLNHPLFPQFIECITKDQSLNQQSVVFEINEGETIFDLSLLKDRIHLLKEHGFLIALDDVGKGALPLATLIELNVNYIKLDRYFSKDLHLSKKKQNLISAFLQYCQINNIKLILEGIENRESLHVASSLGVDMGQGFYLGKPKKLPSFGKRNKLKGLQNNIVSDTLSY